MRFRAGTRTSAIDRFLSLVRLPIPPLSHIAIASPRHLMGHGLGHLNCTVRQEVHNSAIADPSDDETRRCRMLEGVERPGVACSVSLLDPGRSADNRLRSFLRPIWTPNQYDLAFLTAFVELAWEFQAPGAVPSATWQAVREKDEAHHET
jgi:hypothetical protein